MLGGFKIEKQKLKAFERFKGFLYKFRITQNLTVLTPSRIQMLKLLLDVSIIKRKIQGHLGGLVS